jgi:hypothetical protein
LKEQARYREDGPGYFHSMKDQCVLAAAQYILWSGHEQFKKIGFSGDIDEELLRAWKPGSFYHGETGFGSERWRFWKAGFKKMRRAIQVLGRRRGILLEERQG